MSDLRKSPKRRKRTWGEKEALRLKKLREEFGYSSVDPDEPAFSEGMPRIAVRCAYKDIKQTVSNARRKFSPATVAKRTAGTARLSYDQKNELQIWLSWLTTRFAKRLLFYLPIQMPSRKPCLAVAMWLNALKRYSIISDCPLMDRSHEKGEGKDTGWVWVPHTFRHRVADAP